MSDERTIDEMLQTALEVPVIGPAKVILDATMLTTLMSCPRLADFRFNHNLQAISGRSNSLECGLIVHKFMEVYYGTIIKGASKEQARGFGFAAAELYIAGCPHCSDFHATFCNDFADSNDKKMHLEVCPICIPKPICGHKNGDYPGVQNTPRDSVGYKTGWQWVLDTCDQYLNYWRNDHWVPLEVETVKGKTLYQDDEVVVFWKAKLDWVVDTNQGIYSADHKTMKQRRPTNRKNNQFIGQCLIMGTRVIWLNKIGFQTSLKPEEKFERSVMPYSAARLMEWQSVTLPFYAKLLLMYAETGHYPENYDHCEGKYGNCAFDPVCDSDPNMRESEIKRLFFVGPSWNPTNDDED